IPSLPRSTLFPYTTLFRSALPLLAEHGHEEAAVDQHVLLVGVEGARHPQHLAGRERGGHGVLRGVTAGDRHVVVVLDLGVHDQRPLLMTDFVLQHDEPVLLLQRHLDSVDRYHHSSPSSSTSRYPRPGHMLSRAIRELVCRWLGTGVPSTSWKVTASAWAPSICAIRTSRFDPDG